jgi:nitronate monooxygenase
MVLAIPGKGRMVVCMNLSIPSIIQGGMGAGVSNWRLARAVSRLGQLGVVAGTALDQLLSLRLQDGDADGCIRRAWNTSLSRVAKRFWTPISFPAGETRPHPASPVKC